MRKTSDAAAQKLVKEHFKCNQYPQAQLSLQPTLFQ
jgi:hypothetical protein